MSSLTIMARRTRAAGCGRPRGRKVSVRAFPISIDVSEVTKLASDPDVLVRSATIREEIGAPQHVLLGVDRLDYTKGIGHRLKAWSELLADGEVSPQRRILLSATTTSPASTAACNSMPVV